MLSKSRLTRADVIERIVRLYGLEPVAVLPPQKGYRNESYPVRMKDGRTLNLMIYKSEPGILRTIQNANRVSDFLVERGFPARRTVDGRIIQQRSSTRRKYAGLYTYLPGQTIVWEAYSQKHIKLLGKIMSDMHAALREIDSQDLPNVADQYLQIVNRMHQYFLLPGVRYALVTKLQLDVSEETFMRFNEILRLCQQLPNQQVLHMDFVRGNILFDDSTAELAISGILDFEKTAFGSPLFDVARTLAFLSVDCKYKSADKVRKYFLRSGYQKRGAAALPQPRLAMHGEDVNLLQILISLFLFYDFYKFLRHNPYEALLQNEHFVRTCDLIVQRSVVGVAKSPAT